MPNIKSAKKRVLVNATKNAQNKAVKKVCKESIKSFETAAESNASDAVELHKAAVSAIDKACSKGVLAKNTAARRKANLAKKLAK